MSSIPNSAMPHAKESSGEGGEQKKKGRGAAIKQGASKLKDKAKENPKTAIAAGAAVVAAAVGAAALGARKKSASTKSGGSKSTGTKSTSKSANTKSDGRKSKSST